MSVPMAPVVSFGEVLLRLSPPNTERLFQSPSLRTWWGGAEANVAAGLANLGTAAQHVTQLPEGPIGDAAVRRAIEGLEAARVANGPWPAQHQLAHLQLMDPADYARLQGLATANIQPLWARLEPPYTGG